MEKRILLIDDDADERLMFCTTLEVIDSTVQCETAANWSEAEHILESRTALPDLIFLDINIPLYSGWQCLELLKRNGRYRDIPVIMYSTSSYHRDIQIAQDLGAISYLIKPFDFTEHKAMLKQALTRLESNTLSGWYFNDVLA